MSRISTVHLADSLPVMEIPRRHETWWSITRALMQSELFKVRKRPLWWVLLILDIGSAFAFYGVSTLVALIRDMDSEGAGSFIQPQRMMESSIQLNALVVSIAVLVFAASTVGNEFGWGTIRPLIARSGNRASLLTAKLLTVGTVLLALQVVGLLACILGSFVATLIVHRDLDVGAGDVITWCLGLLRLLIAALPLTAIGFLIAMWFRSASAGIGVGIGFAFIEPAGWAVLRLLTSAFDPVQKFGIDYPSRRLVHYGDGSAVDVVGFREGLELSAICLAWAALAMVVTFVVFRRRDVTG